ncbi:hypothetical protein N7470_000891 [Penicillium chermesinum]|nr:hypothetical protein N7470_000891 [Penicillium chermesinum]
MAELSSAERKRLRDRRAQQNLRDKKLRRITELEERVAHCESHHDDQGVQRLLEVIAGLRKQNQALISQRNDLKALVNSWPDVATPSEISNPWLHDDRRMKPGLFLEKTHAGDSPDTMISSPARSSNTSKSGLLGVSTPPPPGNNPAWNRLPLYCDDFSDVRNVSLPWLAYPERIAGCPDIPSSPLEILYGTRTNYLADTIHSTLDRRLLRDPEKMAMGLMTYHFTQWIMSPSPERFELVPSFMRPIPEQFKSRIHLLWLWHFYENNRDVLFGMFACCIKIRWPWGESILERDENNELRLIKDFYKRIMSEDGWGITSDFVRQYPGLAAGVDIDSIIYKDGIVVTIRDSRVE